MPSLRNFSPSPLFCTSILETPKSFVEEIGAINILITRRRVSYPEKLRGKLFIFVFLRSDSLFAIISIDYEEKINSIVIS